MVRGVGLVFVVLLGLALGAVGSSFDFYRAGDSAVGLFNNLTGDTVNGRVLRFSGPADPLNAIGVGADMLLASNAGGELHYAGSVVPNGTWEVDWLWDGPRLDYAAWLRDGTIVEEIPVHNPTAAFGMIGHYAGQRIRFFAPASSDPDGQPLARYVWQWSDGAVAEGMDASRTFAAGDYEVVLTVWDVDGNHASRSWRFEIRGCTLIVKAQPEEAGSVLPTPDQFEYEYGAEVVLVALPGQHWEFVGWSGDAKGTTNPSVLTIVGDMTVVGNFARLDHPKAYITNYSDYSVSVIDTFSDAVVATIPLGYAHAPHAIAIGGDKAYVVTQGGDNVSVIDISTDTVTATLAIGVSPYTFATPYAIAISGDRAYLTNQGGDRMAVIDTATDTFIGTTAVGNEPRAIAISGSKAYVVNEFSDSVSVVNTVTGAVIATVGVGDAPYHITIGGGRAYVANYRSHTVSVIDISTDSVVATVAVADAPWSTAIDGGRAYVADAGHDPANDFVSVIDVPTNEVIATIQVENSPLHIAFNGHKAYVTNFASDSVSVIDTTTGTVIATVAVGDAPDVIAITEGKAYVVNRLGDSVSVIDVATDTVIATVGVGDSGDERRAIAISPT